MINIQVSLFNVTIKNTERESIDKELYSLSNWENLDRKFPWYQQEVWECRHRCRELRICHNHIFNGLFIYIQKIFVVNGSVETNLLVIGKKTVPWIEHSHCPCLFRAPGPVQVWIPAASNSRTITSRDKSTSNSRRKSPNNSSLNVSAVKLQKLSSNELISNDKGIDSWVGLKAYNKS